MPRVLVVDDEESIRFTFRRFLEDEGYAVETAVDFNEALTKIGQADYELVLTDILLGGKTGIDLLKEARGRHLNCPVIMITGYPNIESASEAVRLGAFDYIPKPVKKETLLRVAHQAIEYKRVVDEKERYRSNLEAIYRSVKDAIITVNEELVVLEVNEATRNICGFSRDVIGKSFGSLPLDCGMNCREAVSEAIRERKALELSRIECKHLSRSDQIVSITIYPLLNSQGKFSGAVMVIKDETRLAVLERDMQERRQFHRIIGRSKKMQEIYSLIETLADLDTTVLITGESGTGKELVAEALHYKGIRHANPLIKVNCSALSENLLESELFGHVRGSFTGAFRDQIGRFESAHGGTVFLDEIGEISPKIQLSLLRVLQDKEFERVGDSKPLRVDVRVIAATNRDLREKVRLGLFREDLYYRLKVVGIVLPPLWERREDIPLLVEHFIRQFNIRLNREVEAVSDSVMKVFMNHSWPGNVRELEHALEHAFVLCRQNIIAVEHLPPELKDMGDAGRGAIPCQGQCLPKRVVASAPPGDDFLRRKQQNERHIILQTLKKTGGNRVKASRDLGISQRTIYRKIAEFGITDEEILGQP